MSWRKNFIALLLLAGLAAAGWYAWTHYLRKAEPTGEGMMGGFAIPVDAAAVKRGTLVRKVEAVGTLRADEQATLRPEIGGYVQTISFREGQSVTAGTLLVKIEDSIFQAELAQAQANYDLSQENFQRAEQLSKTGSGTTRARDEALAELLTDKAALALAQTRVDKTAIRAPFDGILGLREVSVGEYVTEGQALVTLQDIDRLKVDLRVPELYLSEISVGQPLQVRADALPDQSFEGEVYAIDPQVDVNGRALVIRATLANDGRLRPGLFARVDLVLERRDGALTIPEAALIPTKQGDFVFRVVNGVAALTPVKTGMRQDAEVEVLEGVTEGDIVVTGGQLKLQDGLPVMLPPELAGDAPAGGQQPEGSQSEGSQSEGSQSEGSQSEGSQSEGSQSEGSQSEGSQSEGSQSEGSQPGDSQQ